MRRKGCGCLVRPILWLLMFFIIWGGINWGAERLFPMPFAPAVHAAAEREQVSPSLLYAIMKAESNFDASAVSDKGAVGLMQLMRETAAECAEKSGLPLTDIQNPEENIALGAYYLGKLLALYEGDESCAVAAYNAGYGRVDGWLSKAEYSEDGKTLSKIPFPETERYVRKVQLYKKIYEWRMHRE